VVNIFTNLFGTGNIVSSLFSDGHITIGGWIEEQKN
jgi:hypothetical protein